MKVTLTKETNREGEERFYVREDGRHIQSFNEHEEIAARHFFEKYGSTEPKIELLKEKEV